MNQVLIMGRPNVGKSSLFNRLIKNRRSLVLDEPGVTRDLIKGHASWWGHQFEVWDSGGLTDHSSFSKPIQKKVQSALQKADIILFVVDAQVGLHEYDKKILKWIQNKKFLLIVNKVDHQKKYENQLNEFYALSSSFIPASFEKSDRVDQIIEWVIQHLDSKTETKKEDDISLLITGQPNVGKSSLCNLLLKRDRMIVSPQAHTTVDVVDEYFEFAGQRYQILDTAGLRKKSKRTQDLEKISSAKTLSSFHKADLILLVIDSSQPLARQDLRLFSQSIEKFKPCILVCNKWDLGQKIMSKNEMRSQIKFELSFFSELPVVFTNALEKKGVQSLMESVDLCFKKSRTMISTPKLNHFLKETVESSPPPLYGTKNVKFYYLTQVKKRYPSFLIFTNEPQGVALSYQKFLVKKIQQQFNLQGIPIQTNFKSRKS